MRKLVFILALFCCTTQVMAQCPTFQSSLSGKCLFVTAAGAKRTVGPIQFLSSLPSQFVASDTLTPGAQVQGLCVNNKIAWDVFFFGVLTQRFRDGTLSGSNPVKASGGTLFAGNSQLAWSATVGPCNCPPIAPNACSECVNLQSDANNCGFCGKTCTGGQICNAGVCAGGQTCKAGCVPINKKDSSKPKVTILVEGLHGFEEETTDDRGNNSETPPTHIRCIVEDPDGVRSVHLEVSDPTVDSISCHGSIHIMSTKVIGLPAPKDIQVIGNAVPTQLPADLIIPGGFLFAVKPTYETADFCSPANTTSITVRCTGNNWSANAASYSDQKTLQINF